jgi:hypothetical protein
LTKDREGTNCNDNGSAEKNCHFAPHLYHVHVACRAAAVAASYDSRRAD